MFFGGMRVGLELDPVSSSSSMMKIPKKMVVDVDADVMFDEVVKVSKMMGA